jgi:protoheme ferro-lyase
MVFMNMGGPSTTDEVGDFLSRLFVCQLGSSYKGNTDERIG